MKCISCRQGFTWECEYDGKCDSVTASDISNDSIDNSDAEDSTTSQEIPGTSTANNGHVSNDFEGREVNTHNDHNLKDQQSTGRKRAAIMYPLNKEAACEWKMKKNCGGGEHPIIGCLNGKQQARHHGPDKNTLNNDEGNVHRICHSCHNRWHTENDTDYVWGTLHAEHSPVEATLTEIGVNEMQWAGRQLVKANDDK